MLCGFGGVAAETYDARDGCVGMVCVVVKAVEGEVGSSGGLGGGDCARGRCKGREFCAS